MRWSPSGLFFCACLELGHHPRVLAVVGIVRIHTYKAGEFLLVDVPHKKARQKAEELRREGRIITHTELV